MGLVLKKTELESNPDGRGFILQIPVIQKNISSSNCDIQLSKHSCKSQSKAMAVLVTNGATHRVKLLACSLAWFWHMVLAELNLSMFKQFEN